MKKRIVQLGLAILVLAIFGLGESGYFSWTPYPGMAEDAEHNFSVVCENADAWDDADVVEILGVFHWHSE